MLESFRATPEWLHISSLCFYFTCNFEEQNVPSAPIFRAYSNEMCIRWIVDNFGFATNKAFNICIGMSMLFWLGSFWSSWNLVGSISWAWVSSSNCCWGCSCSQSAIVDGQAQPALWQCTVCRQCTTYPLSESVSNLCFCFRTSASAVSQQIQSASVRVNSDQVTEQSSRCRKKTRTAVCSYIEQPRESCSGPALRHYGDFNIATAQRQRKAMQVFIQINLNEICSRDTALCSRWKCTEC